MIEHFKELGNDFYFLDTKTISDSTLIDTLGALTYTLSEITYIDYKKNIKPTWSLEKCRDKITKQYNRLYVHATNGCIDFLLGATNFNYFPKLKKSFSKAGFFCYNKELLENKELRNDIYTKLMNLLKSETSPNRLFFGEIPVEAIKMKHYSMKYGGWAPCADINTTKELLAFFNVDAKSEPKMIETQLKDFIIKEAAYETYYKPHSIFFLSRFL